MASHSRTKLNTFLDHNKAQITSRQTGTKTSTHTRMGNLKDDNRKKDIYPGSYNITPENYEEFLSLYVQSVIVDKNLEYLTEKQLNPDVDGATGPCLIDLDFRYKSDVVERQHTEDHITDLIEMYNYKLVSKF